MKVLKVALKLDSIIQGLLLLSILIIGIAYAWTMSDEILIYHMVLMFLLGSWQIASAILFWVILRDKKRRTYFPIIALYFLGFLALLPIIENSSLKALWFVYIGILPLGIAVYYFKTTFNDMIKSHYFKRSFWDL